MSKLETWSPYALSLLRVIAGLLFLEHGLMKLIHFPAAQPGLSGDLPPMLLAAAIIEAVGGGLITLGLFTRFAAFIASGEMAAAYFMAHFKRGFWPALNGGDAAILFCFVFFYLVFAGAGAVSLDQMIRKPR
jgi:putative oxidoreductase